MIPTLRRADTLAHSLGTLCRQPYDDLEIIVQNNGSDPAVREVAESAGDVRIRHVHTDDVVSMTENWELALAHSRGEWVTFIGDDDGLMPDACAIAARVLDSDDAELLSWEPFLYYWPEYFDPRRRNILQAPVNFEFEVHALSSRPLLRRFYAFESHYSKLPMIYNSFVKRTLIDRVTGALGRYFLGSSPDVTSGIVNAAFAKAFLRSTRPLSVAGLSHHSIGQRLTQTGRPRRDALVVDFPVIAEVEEEEWLSTLELGIAHDMLIVKDAVLAEDTGVELDRRGLVRTVAAAINNNPDRYEDARAALDRLMTRFGIDRETVWIPPKMDRPRPPAKGAHVRGPHEVLFVLDGDAVGLRSIDDAVRLGWQLLSADADFVRREIVEQDVAVVTAAPAIFAKNGDGLSGLASGWGEPESWGTWSVDRESAVRIRIPTRSDAAPCRLALQYRIIPFPNGAPNIVRCAIGGELLCEWRFVAANAKGEVTIEIPPGPASDIIELRMLNVNSKSPAELGVSADARLLGIGVEQIRLVPG